MTRVNVHHILRMEARQVNALSTLRERIGDRVLTEGEREMIKLSFPAGINSGVTIKVVGSTPETQFQPLTVRSSDLRSLLKPEAMIRRVNFNSIGVLDTNETQVFTYRDISPGAIAYLRNNERLCQRLVPVVILEKEAKNLQQLNGLLQGLFTNCAPSSRMPNGFTHKLVDKQGEFERGNYILRVSEERDGAGFYRVSIHLSKKNGKLTENEMCIVHRYGFEISFKEVPFEISLGYIKLELQEDGSAAKCFWHFSPATSFDAWNTSGFADNPEYFITFTLEV